MCRGNTVRAGEIGDRARDAQHAVVGAGGQAEPLDGGAQQPFAHGIDAAVLTQLARFHLAVVATGASGPEAVHLPLAGRKYTLAQHGAALAAALVGQSCGRERGHLDVQVDAIEQWPRHTADVALDLGRATDAAPRPGPEMAAWTRIHRRDEHDARGVRQRDARAANDDPAILEWLAKRFQRVAPELRQLIEEQHAGMRE